MILPPQLIVDASVAIKWVVDEARSAEALLLKGCKLVAPDFLFVECANALWKYVIRKQISRDEARTAIETLTTANIETIGAALYIEAATLLAADLGHPVYDCFYLTLADDLSLPLVTDDEQFVGRLERNAHRLRERVIPLSALNDEAAP